jgi:hypothetical protein
VIDIEDVRYKLENVVTTFGQRKEIDVLGTYVWAVNLTVQRL